MRTNEQGDVILNIGANTSSAKAAINELGRSVNGVFKAFKGQSISTPQLDKLNAQLEQSKKKVESLKNEVQSMQNSFSDKPTPQMQRLIDKENELEAAAKRVKDQITSTTPQPLVDKYTKEYDGIRKQIDNVVNEQLKLTNGGKAFVTVAQEQPKAFERANEQLRQEQSNLSGIKAKIAEVNDSGNKSASNVGNTFKRMGNSVSNAFRRIRTNAKSTSTSAADSFGNINKSIKKGITTLIKYGLGIRSIFFLFRKIRSAVVDSYKDLASYSDEVNKSVSTAKSAITQLKNSLSAMIQPLVTTFAPLVTSLANKLTVVAQKAGQFFAALTGQDYVYEAAKIQEDYAGALDDTADSANKAADSLETYLSPLDNINRYTSNSSTSSSDSTGAAETAKFTRGTVENSFKDLAEKLKDYFKDIFAPIKSAWDKYGAPVVREWKRLLNNIKGLISDIAQSFRRVWTNGSGERVVGNILKLFRSVLHIINSIAETLRTAWNKDSLGDSVIQSFIDRFNNLLELIRAVADDFSEVWNDGTGERIWTNILTIVRNINNIIGGFWAILKKAWTQNDNGKRIWQAILGTVEDITEWLRDMSDITLDWITDLNLSPVVSAFNSLLEAIRKLAKVIGEKLKDAYKNVLLPIAKWTIEKGLPALIEAFATALKFVSSVLKSIPISVLTGLASGIAAVFVAIKAYQTVKAAWEYIKGLGVAFKALQATISSYPYAAAILAIVGAIAAVTTAIQVANRTKWNASSLKKSTDEINGYFDDVAEAAQNMRNALEEVSKTNVEVKADVSQVETLKERLINVIKDGIIDEEEMPEYETIINLLKEVDGFEEMWNGMELQEIDGKIHVNADEAIKQLEEFVEKWKLTQWQTTLSSDYSALYSALGINKRDLSEAKTKMDQAYKNLKSYFDEKMAGQYEQYGIYDVDSLVEYYKQHGKISGLGLEGANDLVESYVNANTTLTDLIDSQGKLSVSLKDNWEAQRFLNGETDNYVGALYAVDSGLMSESDALALLKDQGITSYDQLVAKANEQKESQLAANGETAQSNATVGDSYTKIGDAATTAADIAKSGMDSLVATHGGGGQTIEETNNNIEKSNNSLSNNSIKMSGSVADAFVTAFGRIREKAANLWDRLKEMFSGDNGIGKGIANFAITGINKIIGAVNSAINTICNLINNGFSGIRDFELFGAKPFSWLPTITPPQIPEIPALARGAVLPAGKPFVAMLGDQKNGNNLEAPESLIRKIVREESQANKSQPIVAPVNIDGQHFFDIVIERCRAYIAQTGHNPFTTAVGGN